MRALFLSTLIVICLAAMPQHRLAAQTYRFVPLQHPDGVFTPTAINNALQIAGTLIKTDNTAHAVVRQPGGQFVPLPEQAGNQSRAFGMNDRGDVGGWTLDGNGFGRPGVWRNGVFTEQAVPSGAVTVPIALDLNNTGEAVGYYRSAGQILHAFYWNAQGAVTKLPELGGASSIAYAINDSGRIVGAAVLSDATNHAVLWERDSQTGNWTILDLGTLGGPNSIANDINNAGQIVGAAQDSPTTNHAFLWEGGSMKDLGTLGGSNSGARAINEEGVIVGASQDTTQLGLAAANTFVDLQTVSRARAEAMEDVPGVVPSPMAQGLNGTQDRAAKLKKNPNGIYTWRDYNKRLPAGSSSVYTNAFALNDARAALVSDASNAYGFLLPFALRNSISQCVSPTGPCPEIEGVQFFPHSGSFIISTQVGATTPFGAPLLATYSSLPDIDGDTQIFGTGWQQSTGGGGVETAYFEAGYAEVCYAGGRMDVFADQGGTYQQQSNCQRDMLSVGGGLAQIGSPAVAGALMQPAMVLYHASDNLFYFFNQEGHPTAIEDGNGNRRTMTYNAGLLTGIADNFGNTYTLTYDPGKHVSEISDGTRSYQFGYSGGNLTSITDPLGQVTTFTYDLAHPIPGLMTSMTLPRGNTPLRFSYDSNGRLVSVTDGNGGVWTIAYAPPPGNELAYPYSNREVTVTNPLGQSVHYSYDDAGLLTRVLDQAGNAISYSYDDDGHLASLNDRLGGTSQFTDDPNHHRPTSVTEADGTTRTYTYSTRMINGLPLQNLISIQYPDGGSETFGYDAKGNLTSHQDRGGNPWSFSYNAAGLLLAATNPLGGKTACTYNADGTRASVTDQAGNVTLFQYDALKRLTGVQSADGSQVQYTYDLVDRLLTVTDGKGGKRELTYDANGNLLSTKDALGRTAQFTYNLLDRVISFTDHLGAVFTFEYDALNRTKRATDRIGNSLTMGYDLLGRIQSLTNAGGFSWQTTHDAEGIITSSTNPAGITTQFASDPLGRTTGITRGTSASTYMRNLLGQLTTIIGPDGATSTRSVNALGFPDQISLPGGANAGYLYDGAGQLTSARDPEGNRWLENRDAQGRLLSRTDPVGGVTAYSYDVQNRLQSVTFPGGLGQQTNTYDAAGNRIGEAYSDGISFTRSFDAENRLVSMTGATFTYDANGRMTQSNGVTIGRDAGGRVISMTFAPGKTITYHYDSRNLVSAIDDWLGGTMQFTHDPAGRLTTITRPNGITTTITYDDQNRVVGLQEGGLSSITLTRDLAGRTISADRTTPFSPASLVGGTSSFAVDAAARIQTFAYDAMGRLAADGARSYSWNLASQLTGYTKGGTTVAFTHDAAGQRLTRTTGGVTHAFVWNYALDLPAVSVVRLGGSDLRYYVHTPEGLLLASIDAADGARRYYHFDEAGNTLFLTDAAGAVAAAYAYSPYGVLLGSSGSADNPFTFGGQFGVQEEGGLHYMRARYFDGATARFISRDPLNSTAPRLLNPYQYAVGNPLNYGDPTGLKPFELPPSPQAPAPLRPRSEFSSDQDFYRHYDDWNEQMQRWLDEVRERDRRIDELRKQHHEEFLQAWASGWQEYADAVATTNTLVLHLELNARGYPLSLETVRILFREEGITEVEDFEAYLARHKAAALAVHEQAVAAASAATEALLASRREAARPCPDNTSRAIAAGARLTPNGTGNRLEGGKFGQAIKEVFVFVGHFFVALLRMD